MSKKIIPSAHLLECFMPYINDERRMLDVIRRSADIGYYKNFELGVFFDRYNRIYVRNILEEYGFLKVSEEEYEALDKEYLLRVRKESFGYSCLTNQKNYYLENYPGIIVEKGSVDEVISMLVKGELL